MKHLKKTIAVVLVLLTLSAWATLFVAATDADLNTPTGNNGSSETGDPNSNNGSTETGDPNGNNGSTETGDPNGNNGSSETGDPNGNNGSTETGDPTGNTEPGGQPEEPTLQPTVSITANDVVVTVRKKLQLTAEISGFDGKPALTWNTDDKSIATVDQSGKVTGVKAGRATITVTAILGDVSASDRMVINVQRMRTPHRALMQNTPILSYKYNFTDDYYYIQDADCWQKGFGFSKFYDLVAPYLLLEYDYVRVYFTYQDKDYMIQLWKGQYGLIFYGCEQGIYYKQHSDEPDGIFTFYKAMSQSEWPQMEMTLYHDKNRNGNFVREFTRLPETHWWCSGFKFGHLKREEPADELRQIGSITFQDAEMAKLFAEGLVTCGFGEAKDANSIGLDEFCHNGATVSFCWQNINRAETTMPIKVVGGTTAVVSGFAAVIGIFLLILLAIGAIGAGALFLIILI